MWLPVRLGVPVAQREGVRLCRLLLLGQPEGEPEGDWVLERQRVGEREGLALSVGLWLAPEGDSVRLGEGVPEKSK